MTLQSEPIKIIIYLKRSIISLTQSAVTHFYFALQLSSDYLMCMFSFISLGGDAGCVSSPDPDSDSC